MNASGQNDYGAPGDADRDPRLERLYRSAAREEPPARLDAAIHATARREVHAGPRAVPTRLRAWRVPVSIAAVVILSASLVTLVREEGGGQLERSPVTDRYSKPEKSVSALPAPAPDAVTPPATIPAARNDAAPGAAATAKIAEETAPRETRARRVQPTAPEPPAVPPRSAASPPRPFQDAPGERERRPAPSAEQAAGASASPPYGGSGETGVGLSAPSYGTAAGTGTVLGKIQRDRAATSEAADSKSEVQPPPAAAPAEKSHSGLDARALRGERPPLDLARVAALVKELGSKPPEKWLETIEDLRREGRQAESDGLLAEFKRRFPRHPLPPSLR